MTRNFLLEIPTHRGLNFIKKNLGDTKKKYTAQATVYYALSNFEHI